MHHHTKHLNQSDVMLQEDHPTPRHNMSHDEMQAYGSIDPAYTGQSAGHDI